MLPLKTREPIEIELEDPEHRPPCTASFHPDHEVKCGKAAAYAILAICPICEMRPRYLCVDHCASFFPSFVGDQWCACDRHLAPHDLTAVTVRGL